MMRRICVSVLVFLCLYSSVLFSRQADKSKLKDADMTFYGLHLGEKFSIPECNRHETTMYGRAVIGYDIVNEFLCFEWTGGYESFNFLDAQARIIPVNTPVVTDRVMLVFPNDIRPMYTATSYMLCLVVDGKLARVRLPTAGLKWQDYWLGQLKQKYGPPAQLKEIAKENGFGAVFNSYEAIWGFANLHIDFYGTLDSTDSGVIDVVTNEGAEFLGGTRNVDHPAPSKPKPKM
jgi:hypothetical protein